MSHADYEILVHLSEADDGPHAHERAGRSGAVLPQPPVPRRRPPGALGLGRPARAAPPTGGACYAHLTAEGRAALEAAAAGHVAGVRRYVFDALDAADVGQLERLATRDPRRPRSGGAR